MKKQEQQQQKTNALYHWGKGARGPEKKTVSSLSTQVTS